MSINKDHIAKLLGSIRDDFASNPNHEGVRELELICTEGAITSARVQDGKGRFYVALAQDSPTGPRLAKSGPYTRLDKREDGTYLAESNGYRCVLDKMGDEISANDTDQVRTQIRMLGDLWDYQSGRDW